MDNLPDFFLKKMITPNPDLPLPFESISGAPAVLDTAGTFFTSAMLEMGSDMGMEVNGLAEFKSTASRYYKNGINGLNAALHALGGYWNGANHAAIAKEALEIGEGVCPEAHVMLGQMTSQSYEEAMGHFRRAVAQCEEHMHLNKYMGKMWDAHPCRVYMRALHGLANTRRKMGNMADALEAYKLLVRADNTWPNSSQYANYRYHIPEVFLSLNDTAGFRTFFDSHCRGYVEKLFLYASTGIPWSFGCALLQYMELRERNKRMSIDAPEIGVFVSKIRGAELNLKMGVTAAVQANAHVIEYLSGTKPLPDFRAPFKFSAPHTECQALVYVKGAKKVWESVPGSIRWLRQQTNTHIAIMCCEGAERFEVDMSKYTSGAWPQDIFTLAGFRRIMESGEVYLTCESSGEGGKRLLHDAVMGWASTAAHVRLVVAAHKKRGIDLETSNFLTPMHMACYYDAPEGMLHALIDGGARVHGGNFEAGGSPLLMAANQGNWRAIKTILAKCPNFRTVAVLDELFEILSTSTCHACINGGKKCQRCVNDPHAGHSPSASFEKCTDVLIEYGYKLKKSTKTEMGAYLADRLRGAKEPSTGGPRRYFPEKDVSHMHPHHLRDLCAMWGLALPMVEGADDDTNLDALYELRKQTLALLKDAGAIGAGRLVQKKAAAASREAPAPAPSHGHGHSHGGAPCHGHGHAEAPAPAPSHGHGHSHGGVECHGHGHAETAAAAPQKEVVRACAVCGVRDGPLSKCGRCRSVFYCGKAHQVEHWPSHKQSCGQR